MSFYDIKPIKSVNAQWNIIHSGRGNGKSYSVKSMAIQEAIENLDKPKKKNFFYLRRLKDHITNDSVYNYLRDLEEIPEGGTYNKLYEISQGRFNRFKVARGKIFALWYDEETDKESDIQTIGYCKGIPDAEGLKSQQFPDVYNIIFEELFATGTYLPREAEKLFSIVSTVLRNREGRIWMIGNEEFRSDYYFNFFDITQYTKKQKMGTIITIELDAGTDEFGNKQIVKMAVEYAHAKSSKNSGGMFFGRMKSKIEEGGYTARLQPRMSQQDFEAYEKIFHMYFEKSSLKYDCYLCLDELTGGCFWWIRPFTKTIRPGNRVVSDTISTNPMITNNLNPLNKGEAMAFDLLINNKVFFSDDLCGTEFREMIKYFINSNITQDYR